MKVKHDLTPYPVLADFLNDYEAAWFKTEVELEEHYPSSSINAHFDLADEAIEHLIQTEQAAYALHCECPRTSFRKIVLSGDPIITLDILNKEIKEYLEISTFIIATENIKAFASRNFHSDYKGYEFDLFKGNILAATNTSTFDIDNENNPNETASIIRVIGNPRHSSDSLHVNTDSSDFIYISLTPDLFLFYSRAKAGIYKDTVFALVLLPALQTVLSRMAEDDEDDEKKWFRVISQKLENSGIHISELGHSDDRKSVLSASQQIFNQPIARSMNSLKELMEDYDED